MNYELTDEEIIIDICGSCTKEESWTDADCKFCQGNMNLAARLAQNKLLKYYRDMTPEGLRKEIRQIFTDEILLSFWTHEKCPPNQQEIKGCQLESDVRHERCMPCWEKWLEALIDQIPSLVSRYFMEKLERIEEPEFYNDWGGESGKAGWNEAIQAVKDIFREVK